MWLVWKKTPKQSAGELLSRYLRAFIIWPSTIDTEQTSCVSQTELKGNMYTLKKTIEKHRNPFDIAHQTPRENASHHIKERRKKIGENIWSHVRMRDIILMYKTHRHFSTRPEKNTKKGQKKIIMYPVTPRGTQCDTLYYCKHIPTDILLQSGERKGQLCLQMAFVSCTLVILNVVQ